METEVKARKIGGSIAIFIPNSIVSKQRISPDDKIRIRVEKVNDLGFLWGKLKGEKKSTQEIMNEIDQGEDE